MRIRPLLAAVVALGLLSAGAPRALATSPGDRDVTVLQQAALRLRSQSPPAVVRWLRARNEVGTATVGRDGRTVDVRFRDGREMLVLPADLSRVPVSAFSEPLSIRPHVGAQQSAPRAAVLEPFASELFIGNSSDVGAPEISALQKAGFSVTSLNDAAVTVQFMASLAQFNVVYMHTHSGTTSGGDGVVATGELAGNDPFVAPYLGDGSVVQVGVAGSANVYYGLTSRFFLAHGGPFPRDSLLFFNGCKLLPASAFWNALASRGAGALLSWTEDAVPLDEYEAGAAFFNFMSGGQSVSSALQATQAAGYGKSTYNGVTATLGYRGDGSITLARAAGGQVTPSTSTPAPTGTPVPTEVATGTAIPTSTSVPTAVPTNTVPRPTETSVPFVLRIAGLARMTVNPGQMQRVTVQSLPNTTLVLWPIMPDGTSSLVHFTTDASGTGQASFKQAGSRITRHSRVATVAVRVGNDARDREVTAHYTIGFARIDIAVDKHSPAEPGRWTHIWVHTAGRTRVDLTANAPHHRAADMHSFTASNGWAGFRYLVPGNAARGSVSLAASAHVSGKVYSARSALAVS